MQLQTVWLLRPWQRIGTCSHLARNWYDSPSGRELVRLAIWQRIRLPIWPRIGTPRRWLRICTPRHWPRICTPRHWPRIGLSHHLIPAVPRLSAYVFPSLVYDSQQPSNRSKCFLFVCILICFTTKRFSIFIPVFCFVFVFLANLKNKQTLD